MQGGPGRSHHSCRALTGIRQYLGSDKKKGTSSAQRQGQQQGMRRLERQRFPCRVQTLPMSLATPSQPDKNSPAPRDIRSPLPNVCPCMGAAVGAGHGDMPSGTAGMVGSQGLCQEVS